MSQELPSNKNTNEEVDLIVFFNLIGNALNRVFSFIGSIFKGIYSIIIKFLQQLFLNLKIIAAVVIIALVAGYFVDKTKSKVYFAEMYVVPNFGSNYELINNISYFNSLIALKDTEELSKQFNTSKEESEAIIEFDIEIGPESQNEQLLAFNGFIKSFDSIARSKFIFEDYINNRNLYSASILKLKARSKDYKIFKKLELGLSTSLNSDLSVATKKERDAVLQLEKENLQATLIQVRALKKTYLDVLEKESNKTNVSSSLEGALGFQVEKTQTKEDLLLAQELKILEQLSNIEKVLITSNTIFDQKSSFKEKGLLENIWYKKYKIILPILALCLLGFFNYMIMMYKHVINYK